jgi:hypothetical protein
MEAERFPPGVFLPGGSWMAFFVYESEAEVVQVKDLI